MPIEPTIAAPPTRSALAGAAILVLATALWGSTFTAIKLMLHDVSPAMMTFTRFALATLALSPFARRDQRIWRTGIELAIWLFAGFAMQTVGLRYTSINRSAFITAMNVIFVPMLAAFAGRRIGPIIWAAAITALIGCGLLSYDGAGPNIGDAWTLATAVVFAVYIFRMESAARSLPSLPLALAQVVPVAVFSGIWTATGRQNVAQIHAASWGGLVYLGIAATAATTWLQAVGQRIVPAPQAAVIYTLEPVFAALCGYAILHETLTPRAMTGAGLILLAAVTSQLPSLQKSSQKTD